MSLADVQEMTKIQKRYLTGIEEGNYDMMPGKFYIRAFIKQYAEAVGLNPDELFEEYKSEIPSSHEDQIPQRATNVESAKSTVPREPSKLLEYLPKIVVTAFIIGVLVLLWYFISKSVSGDQAVKEETVVEESQVSSEEDKQTEAPKKEKAVKEEAPKEQPKAEEQEKQVLKAAGVSGSNATYQLENAEKFELTVSSKGSTWVGVTDGSGKSRFGDMIPSGETQSFDLTGQTSAKIRVGNAPDTEIKVNGETLKYQIPAANQVTQNIIIQVQQTAE
uniref:helix-turn-helix domain-containing protein n=1 Tax=Bacillus xiapuensis TaxID=2014075 RepID=UPI0038BC908F